MPSQPHCSMTSALQESGKLSSFNLDSGNDYARLTMKTRVAVRDKTPHRFQVVSLRDVSQLETSSASQSENASRLRVPPMPHKSILRPNPDKPSISKAKRLPSSASLKNSLEILSKTHALGNKPELGHDGTLKIPSLATPKKAAVLKSRSDTSMFSVASPHIMPELDTNLPQLRRSSPQTIPVSEQAPSIPGIPSSESIIKLIRSESPLTHTISRSLQGRTPHERTHARFASLSDFNPPDVPPLNAKSRGTHRRVKTKSDANISSRLLENAFTDDASAYCAQLDLYDSVDPKSRKRHAIYTPSLYVPVFDQSSQFKKNQDVPSHSDWQIASTHEDPVTYVNLTLEGGPVLQTDSHCKPTGCDINAHDVDSLSEARTDAKSNGPMNCLPVTTGEHHLTHKSSSQRLRLQFSDKLSSSKGLRKQSGPAITEQHLLGEIVFSPLVLDLFADIDKAIAEWNSAI